MVRRSSWPTKSIAGRRIGTAKFPACRVAVNSLEITVAIAYQVYIVGLSFDKVCLLMNFFQNLRLRKSQADAVESVVAALGKRIRGALHAAGEFGRRAYRRNELESEQRL